MTDNNSRYVERDISWLSFNERVLQEAKDPMVPLFERLKFLAIFSSNLDEFYRVRVASMRSFRKLKKRDRRAMQLRPRKLLKKIRQIVQAQQREFGRIFRDEILPQLADHQIFMVQHLAFQADQKEFATNYYDEHISSLIYIQPLTLKGKNKPFLENKHLYFVVQFEEKDRSPVLINIPSDGLSRFVEIPAPKGEHHYSFLDDIIRYNLPRIFKNKKIKAAFSIKISRDAELYIEDEYSGDLVDKIRKRLKFREEGLPTRFLYDARIPDDLLDVLKRWLHLSKDDLIPGGRYHNFLDFFSFPLPPGNKELRDKPLPPLPHPVFEGKEDLLPLIRTKDQLLHFPYQKYDYITQLVLEAANDPKVVSVKITLYRVASDSTVLHALKEVLAAGKQVNVFVEAKARFDEQANLYWGRELEKAGAEVRYSFPGIKVHTKLMQIARMENDKLKYYTYIGTGNFNEKTALIYTDHALLTYNQSIGKDVAMVFDLLEGNLLVPKTKHLFISPFTTRKKFVKLIDKEIAQAKAGNEAWMFIKMNSLEDKNMIKKIYEASEAGVQIRMIVRGICCAKPGIKGMSENLEIISIVDRFLEHPRVFIFANGGSSKMYIASADWMGRNLDRRVEAVAPVLDPDIQKELRDIMEIQWKDTQKARVIDSRQINKYKRPDKSHPAIHSQEEIYKYLKKKSGVMMKNVITDNRLIE